MARIGQRVESEVVGAQTGLLDQLTSLLGKRRHLLGIDFKTHKTRHLKMPAGWCFVAVDSGVKHDLTLEYNQRRASCEKAAELMRIASLRDADRNRLTQRRDEMPDDAWRCARHVIGENERVQQAHAALMKDDVETLGELMFESHASSRDDLRNSCEQLDALVEHARQDTRCIGARLSGGGFGGISIHLVREEDAKTYLGDLLRVFRTQATPDRWAQVCLIDDGARVE
jgi:galactokinase